MTESSTIFVSKKQLVFFAKVFLALGVIIAVVFSGITFISAKQASSQEIVFDKGIAPNFSLPDLDGKKVSLSDFAGKKNSLLFFNEGAGCGSCFLQIKDMQARMQEFSALDIEIIPISTNPPNVLRIEAQSMNISMPIYYDADLGVSRTYTALKYSMHPGKVPGHTFVLVDKNGEIKWRWDWKQGNMYLPVDTILNSIKDSLK